MKILEWFRYPYHFVELNVPWTQRRLVVKYPPWILVFQGTVAMYDLFAYGPIKFLQIVATILVSHLVLLGLWMISGDAWLECRN